MEFIAEVQFTEGETIAFLIEAESDQAAMETMQAMAEAEGDEIDAIEITPAAECSAEQIAQAARL